MHKLVIIVLFLMSSVGFSQENDTVLSLEEYLGYVKKYHPIVKQAQLITTESEAKLLKSRGAFDPKLEVDYNRKKFKSTTYYDKLNSTFKIPTWYGVELKANYENNDGTYLNPEYNTPDDGLYSAGVSVSLAKGLLTNERMATLKQSKLYLKYAQAEQKLVINDILYNAITTYFNWLKNYQAKLVYSDYLVNADTRLKNVKSSFFAGDKPAIDTLEANINFKSRKLDYEKAKIGYIKSALELSNYLWLENNIPLELEEGISPDTTTIDKIDVVLNSSVLNSTDELIANHPKLQSLQIKQEILTVDKRLKTNNLLPKIDLQYNFLSSDYENVNSFNTANYKSGLNISFPLFLRKERADLRLAKLKLQDIGFDISATKVSLKNKVNATIQEIDSYNTQYDLLQDIVVDYKAFVKSEERKFSLGEGSLFLVNYREVKLIESQLKAIDVEYQLFISKSNLLRVLNNLE
ncbi:TolC family protein [Algibacter lectus]|uniref:Outer membrane protein TolC n=1 Tax=Algibacter lectus TaxID=221126 RepID=A0A4R8MDC3_9FLAO|nr:TolC family protein [Algibacter lectus]MWW23521.1 transporter [Algibacter lectus]TDY63800.1 outer membrane protein TolC [Algibacter lectus]